MCLKQKGQRTRNKKNRAIIITLVVVVVVLCCSWYWITGKLREFTTFGILEQIHCILYRTLGTTPLDEYVITPEMARHIAYIRVKDEQFVDAWDNPLTVTIERVRNEILVRIVSPGRDGKVGTGDDLVFHDTWNIWERNMQNLFEMLDEGVIWHIPLVVEPQGFSSD